MPAFRGPVRSRFPGTIPGFGESEAALATAASARLDLHKYRQSPRKLVDRFEVFAVARDKSDVVAL